MAQTEQQSVPFLNVNIEAAASPTTTEPVLKLHDEIINWQNTKLEKRSIATGLSVMYGILVVSISFTFVIAMIWLKEFNRLTTDVISTIL